MKKSTKLLSLILSTSLTSQMISSANVYANKDSITFYDVKNNILDLKSYNEELDTNHDGNLNVFDVIRANKTLIQEESYTDLKEKVYMLETQIESLYQKLNEKTDAEEGKQLSSNDYTDEEKEKLESLNNYDDTDLKNEILNVKGDLDDKIIPVRTAQKFNKSTVINNAILSPSNGITYLGEGYAVSDYIEIEEETKLQLNYGTNKAFYDADKNFISGDNYKNYTVDVPNGAKYVRVNPQSSQVDKLMVVNYGTDISKYIPYYTYKLNDNISVDKLSELDSKQSNENGICEASTNKINVLVLGTSYSAGNLWLNNLKDMVPINNLVNLASSGATIKDRQSDRESYPYTSRPVADTIGNQNTFGSQIEKLKRLMSGIDLDIGESKLYENESDYPQVIIIECGTNDFKDSDAKVEAYPSQFYTVVDETVSIPSLESIDRTSFGGSIRYVYSTIHTIFPDALFLFVSPCGLIDDINYVNINHVFVGQQIELACSFIGQPVVNWSKCGRVSNVDKAEYSSDTLHPNSNGAKLLAQPVAREINEMIKNLIESP